MVIYMDCKLNISLRELRLSDLDDYFSLNHPDRLHHQYNGPYYPAKSEDKLRDFINELRIKFIQGEVDVLPGRKLIMDNNTSSILGQVNWYWKSIETLWLEVGIVLYDSNTWGHGVGKTALTLWINEIFKTHPNIVRIGLSTWSGNLRMIGLAQKIGMSIEARYKKARIVNGIYYDSLSYGILREEWDALQ